MKVVKPSERTAAAAAVLLKNGGIVICPTDTVYGFLADAQNKKAVEKIYKIKKRSRSKPLSLFVKDFAMAESLAEINQKQKKYIKKHWPGKYTFILNKKLYGVGHRTALVLYGVKKESVAIRIPKHPFLQKLLKKVNRPLVQTSVNISAQAPLNSPEQIMTTFGKNKLVGLIITSNKPLKGKSSKIIDLTDDKLTRLR